MSAVTINLVAESRKVPFLYTITLEDQTWVSPFFAMQARMSPGAAGDALIDLGNASEGAEGIFPEVVGSDTVLTIQIDKTTLGALPAAGEPGGDLELVYDLKVTPSSGAEELLVRGTITIQEGVTTP